jgi:uncharacterized protein
MNLQLIQEVEQQNPWLSQLNAPILTVSDYHQRIQYKVLQSVDWDTLWTVLIGPRRAGKTTLGKYLCQELIKQKRFQQLLYLNCDLLQIRNWLQSPLFITEATKQFNLQAPIIFIDEVQRLPSPGLLLKTIADLSLPIKMIASSSSQLELKSKVQEYLTGRQISSLVLPLSFSEWDASAHIEELLMYGAYPQVIASHTKEIFLRQLYHDYICKDIIEILKIGQPDVFQKLLGLLAHSSGQLVNYNQLANDCQVSVTMIKNYLTISQQTYVTAIITPFVGNKRTELTSNPIIYFLDNGFRNYAIRNFNYLSQRSDVGLLVQSTVFQEIYKYVTQHFFDYGIHYWRTKSGAEVDFVIYKNDTSILPVEVKYRSFASPAVSRGYRSFLQAYEPRIGVIITKDFVGSEKIENTEVHFIPLEQLNRLFKLIDTL